MQVVSLSRPTRVAGRVWRAGRRYGVSPRAILRRALLLRRDYGFGTLEGASLGLLDPSFPESRFADFVPQRRFTALQRRLSPPALTPVIDDKVLFWVACRAAGLPTPEVRAVMLRSGRGWTAGRATPGTAEEWAAALAALPDCDLIAKPVHGDRGVGVRAFELRGGRFAEGGREIGDGGALFSALLADRRFDAFVLQDRLENHETITRLSGARTLQTLRLWTLLETAEVTRPEQVTVLGGKLKFASTESVADNPFSSPAANGFSLVDLETGTLGGLVRLSSDGFGQEELEQHPRSGAVYRGVRIPFWEESLALVRRAAVAFSLLRTLGWDVALTPDGPVLIEANAGWGASNELGVAARLYRRLEEALHAETAPQPTDGGGRIRTSVG